MDPSMSAAEVRVSWHRERVLPVAICALVVLLSACSGRALRGEGAELANGPTTAEERAALDPWEPSNRRMHEFNRRLDRRVMKPVARGYVKVVPRPVRQGVTNLFDNLQEPIVALNLLVQGHGQKATESGFRFLLNSTVGLAGIFDVASAGKVPEYRADFGQTFALWGWQRSRYLVLPVFGPSSVRDGFARVVNSQVSPINTVGTRKLGPGAGVLYGITSRAAALPNEAFAENAADEYLLLRDVYFQRRGCQIRDCSQEVPDYELPDELGVPASDITPDDGP
jgi:phospholipid-binding lipoprotein MlaA